MTLGKSRDKLLARGGGSSSKERCSEPHGGSSAYFGTTLKPAAALPSNPNALSGSCRAVEALDDGSEKDGRMKKGRGAAQGRKGLLARILGGRRPDATQRAPSPDRGFGDGSLNAHSAASDTRRTLASTSSAETSAVDVRGDSSVTRPYFSGAGTRERVCYVEVKSLLQDSDDSDDDSRRATMSWRATGQALCRSRSAERSSSAAGRRPRSSSRSRDIIALYTRGGGGGNYTAAAPTDNKYAAAAAAMPISDGTVPGAAADAPTAWRGGSHGVGFRGQSSRHHAESASSVRSSSYRSVTPECRRRSSSLPRPKDEVDIISINGTKVHAPGYFTEPRRALSSSDIAAANLKVWMEATMERRKSSGRLVDANVDGQRDRTIVLETDRNVEARVESLLSACHSADRADVPMLVVAGYTPDPMKWSAADEISVTAGAVVRGLYKQKEWLRVKADDGREGFIPYAFTRQLRYYDSGASESVPKLTDSDGSRAPMASGIKPLGGEHSVRKSCSFSAASCSPALSSARVTRRADACADARRQPPAAPRGNACKFYQKSSLILGSSDQVRNSDDASSVVSSDDSVFRSPTPCGVRTPFKLPSRAAGGWSPSVLTAGDDGGELIHSDSGISEPGSVRSDSYLGRKTTKETLSSVSLSSLSGAVGANRGSRAACGFVKTLAAPGEFNAKVAIGLTGRSRDAGRRVDVAGRLLSDEDLLSRHRVDPIFNASDTPNAVVRPDIPRNFGGPLVTVAYDYRAVNADDVSVWVGETVRLLNADDIEWVWVKKCDGCEGFIPRQYVEIESGSRACRKAFITAV